MKRSGPNSATLFMCAAMGIISGCGGDYPGNSLTPEEAEELALNDPQFDGHVGRAHVDLDARPQVGNVWLNAGPSAHDVPVDALLEPFNVPPDKLPLIGQFEFDLEIDHSVEECWQHPLTGFLIGTRECMCNMLFAVQDVLRAGLGEIEDGPFEDPVVCNESLREVLMPTEDEESGDGDPSEGVSISVFDPDPEEEAPYQDIQLRPAE